MQMTLRAYQRPLPTVAAVVAFVRIAVCLDDVGFVVSSRYCCRRRLRRRRCRRVLFVLFVIFVSYVRR